MRMHMRATLMMVVRGCCQGMVGECWMQGEGGEMLSATIDASAKEMTLPRASNCALTFCPW